MEYNPAKRAAIWAGKITSMPISGSRRGSGNASAHVCNRPLSIANRRNASVNSSPTVSLWAIYPNSIACRTASPSRAHNLRLSMAHLLEGRG